MTKEAKPRYQTMYDNSFAVIGPRLWNTLPPELSKINCQQQFKNRLTNYLNTIPDKPPTRGYMTVNNNSLLAWSENKTELTLQSRQLGLPSAC